jgi:hypothetical protein
MLRASSLLIEASSMTMARNKLRSKVVGSDVAVKGKQGSKGPQAFNGATTRRARQQRVLLARKSRLGFKSPRVTSGELSSAPRVSVAQRWYCAPHLALRFISTRSQEESSHALGPTDPPAPRSQTWLGEMALLREMPVAVLVLVQLQHPAPYLFVPVRPRSATNASLGDLHKMLPRHLVW